MARAQQILLLTIICLFSLGLAQIAITQSSALEALIQTPLENSSAPDGEDIQGIETVTEEVREQIEEQQQEATEVTILEEDAKLKTRIRTVLKNVDDFSEVDVAVSAGVVKLTGVVSKQESKQAAAELAKSFSGVLYVDNDIVRTADVEDNVLPIIQKARGYAFETIARLPMILIALLVLLAFWWLSRRIARWDAPFNRISVNKLIQGLIQQVCSTMVFIVGLLIAIDIVEATPLVGAVLGTAGIAGVAIGFAFRNIVENYLAGILLSLRQPFAMNDSIKIDAFEGQVVRLTPREVVLMTQAGDHVRIPNGKVFNSVIYNHTRNPRRLFEFDIKVKAEHDILKAQQIAKDTISSITGVLTEPSVNSQIRDFDGNDMLLNLSGWVDQRHVSHQKVRSEAIRLVQLALDEVDLSHDHAPLLTETLETPDGRFRKLESQIPAESQQAHDPIRLHSPEEKQVQDVSVDTAIDKQIIEELDSSDEENLLESVRMVAASD